MAILIARNARFEERPQDSPIQESATAGKGEGRFYAMMSTSGQKNARLDGFSQMLKSISIASIIASDQAIRAISEILS